MSAFLLLILVGALCLPTWAAPPTTSQHIVFLGDSITDGNTYPLLVQQAFREAERSVPCAINAGVGGNTAQQMSARLDRDVLVFHPDTVTLLAGANDALHDVSLLEYSAAVTSIADRLRAAKISLLLLTTTIYGAQHANAEKRLDEYNAWLRAFTKERGLQLGEVNALFRAAHEKDGESSVIEPDGIHPNMAGQRLIARAVLDALGESNVRVPVQIKPPLMSGVLTPWKIAVAPDGKPLDDEAAKILSRQLMDDPQVTANWTEYSLPEAASQAHPWFEQERQRGFALSLDKVVGLGSLWRGATFVNNPEADSKPVFFNTGAALLAVWLNGQRIYSYEDGHGWHAGRERIAALLNPGNNIVLIESGAQFFLSMTNNEK